MVAAAIDLLESDQIETMRKRTWIGAIVLLSGLATGCSYLGGGGST